MDIATFMATVSPIAAVAVLPLAIANGGVFEMSRTGWTYMLILTLLIGVAGHGLMVFAQRSIARRIPSAESERRSELPLVAVFNTTVAKRPR